MFYKYIKDKKNIIKNPIWIMRQAGRYLPEYRAIRKNYPNFLEFCYSKEDAGKVTIQPIKRYDLDAAIIFSDILVILDALNHKVLFKENIGPIIEYNPNFEEILDVSNYNEFLKPVYKTISRVREDLDSDKSLIGFVGGFFTLLAYLIEGRASKSFTKAFDFVENNNKKYQVLKEVIIQAIITHLKNQIDSGVDTVKIFDSHSGLVPDELYQELVIDPTIRIVNEIREYNNKIVIITFPKGSKDRYFDFAQKVLPDVIALDQYFDLDRIDEIRKIKNIVTQGNIDPEILFKTKDDIRKSVENLKKHTDGHKHIYNLGHGVIKTTDPENMAYLIESFRG
jgi:uroporphyrinogen decarboxylase